MWAYHAVDISFRKTGNQKNGNQQAYQQKKQPGEKFFQITSGQISCHFNTQGNQQKQRRPYFFPVFERGTKTIQQFRMGTMKRSDLKSPQEKSGKVIGVLVP